MTSFSSTRQKNDFLLHFDRLVRTINLTKEVRSNPSLPLRARPFFESEDVIYTQITRNMHGSFTSMDKMTRFGEMIFHLSKLVSSELVVQAFFDTRGDRKMVLTTNMLHLNWASDATDLTDSCACDLLWISFSCDGEDNCVRVKITDMTGRRYIWNVYRSGATRMFLIHIKHDEVSSVSQIAQFQITGGGRDDWRVSTSTICKKRIYGTALRQEKSHPKYGLLLKGESETCLVTHDFATTLEHKFSVSGNVLIRRVAGMMYGVRNARLNALADAFMVSEVGRVQCMVQSTVRATGRVSDGQGCRIDSIGGRLDISQRKVRLC